METDDLIDRLVAGHGPVDAGRLTRALLVAVPGSIVASAGLIALTIGYRTGLGHALVEGYFGQKLAFLGLTAVTAAVVFLRMARPGAVLAREGWRLVMPVVFIAALALVDLARRGDAVTAVTIVGDRNWLAGLVLVPLYGLIPFAALVAVVRRGAPTDLVGAGRATGVLAASLTAVAYAGHCPCDDPEFVVLWYPLTFVAAGWLGGRVVPRLVRW